MAGKKMTGKHKTVEDRLGSVIEVKNRKGDVAFLFDTAEPPSRKASLSTRAKFAIAYIKAFVVDKRPVTLKQMGHCLSDLAEVVTELEATRPSFSS